MSEREVTAPAAHMITVEPVAGGGVLVGHLREDQMPASEDPTCGSPAVMVPLRPGRSWVLSIDIIQAILNHRCPEATE